MLNSRDKTLKIFLAGRERFVSAETCDRCLGQLAILLCDLVSKSVCTLT